jgi:D-alanyl-D-alanine dipeptidase
VIAAFHNAENLVEPIPDLTALRAQKSLGYMGQAIDTSHPLHDEELVDIRDFGIPASSYYAQPNGMTGEPLPGVPNLPLVRADVARRLKLADHELRTSKEVREALGGYACLRVDDAIRPLSVQQIAYDEAWPAIIRRKNPTITDEALDAVRSKYIAKPNAATPHATGGAVDVRLIRPATGVPFDRGHQSGTILGTAYPDYYEADFAPESVEMAETRERHLASLPEATFRESLLSRRVLYNAMRAAGFAVNPTEIWHYGKGDPLSGFVDGYKPYYGVAELPEWYQLGE